MINILKNLSLISLIGICFYLGTWQIDRGQEKLSIQRDFESQVNTEYSDIKNLVDKPVRYKKLYATGIFDESFFLLDNIVFKRKAGYYVISPLIIDDKVLLVNRGWVDNYSRQKYPIIETPKSMVTIKGYVKYPMQLLELSSNNITKKKPYIIQNINTKQISKILNKDIYPFIVNLHEENQYAYTYIPIKNENNHLKHYMYAGQWFLFTIIGMFFLFILNRRKNGKS
jgi:cytochrome oxidase assembly protein ShyY1